MPPARPSSLASVDSRLRAWGKLWAVPGLVLALAGRVPADEPPAPPPRDTSATVEAVLSGQGLDLDELLRPVPATEPARALETFEVAPGFELQFVAHEPDVVDPVAGAFDARGRLYVAEMRDYPFRPAPGESPRGTIRLLEDHDGDGRYETSTLFAEGLLWPAGVAPWLDGVFVAAAPEILYLRDTDGDGRADLRRTVFAGFGTQNEQGSVNNLTWGLDGRIYGCASMNGGEIRAAGDGAITVSIKGRDFSFDPWRLPVLADLLPAASRQPTRDVPADETPLPGFRFESGNSQFGMAWDDWGNRFLCSESDATRHVVLPGRYLARNPHVRYPHPEHDLNPGVTPVFRLSPLEGWRVVRSSRRLASGERSARAAGASHDVLDGAAGPVIYRGDAWPGEFVGQLLVGDAQNNLVHRRRLTPAGVSFDSTRVDEGTEFVRSRDNWFRPVNLLNAPDGTLFLCDMYRHQIESVHVPLDVWKKLDLTLGRDRGRIYRLVPRGFRPQPIPRLDEATSGELVAALASANGWRRTTAQRLLLERREPSAVAPLRELLARGPTAVARLHALTTLGCLGELGADDLAGALADPDPRLSEHALRWAETSLPLAQLLPAIRAALDSPDPRLRLQAVWSAGELVPRGGDPDQVVELLWPAVSAAAGDPWLRAAVFSSLAGSEGRMLARAWADASFGADPEGGALLVDWARALGRQADEPGLDRVLTVLATARPASDRDPLVRRLLLALDSGRRAAGTSLTANRASFSTAASALLDAWLARALATLDEPTAPPAEQATAVATLALAPWELVDPRLERLLAADSANPPLDPVWSAVVELLQVQAPAEAPRWLLAPWPHYLPPARQQVLTLLASRAEWLAELLAALESGQVAKNQVPATLRETLRRHPVAELARRAEALWSAADGTRAEALAQYLAVLDVPGESPRGRKIYERECQACHQIGETGHAVGPNLALTRHRLAGELLVHILDPNREMQPAYVQYIASDQRGAVYTGILTADNASGITLAREQGRRDTILREDLAELASTDRSLMPEGFEKTISPAEMADLLAYLTQLRYDLGTDPGHEEPPDDARSEATP